VEEEKEEEGVEGKAGRREEGTTIFACCNPQPAVLGVTLPQL